MEEVDDYNHNDHEHAHLYVPWNEAARIPGLKHLYVEYNDKTPIMLSS
jgi:hypothetical protein